MKRMKQFLALTLCLVLALCLAPGAQGDDVKITNITISPGSVTLPVGGSETLKVSIQPANATNSNVEIVSTDSSIATVSSDGRVTGVAPGYCLIYANALDGSAMFGSCSVTVLEKTKVTVNPANISLQVGESTSISYTITPYEMSTNVKMSSSDPSIASVSNAGTLIGVSTGTATIYVRANDGTTGTANISVGVLATDVKVTPGNLTINTGSHTTLTATITPANATYKNLTWKSSNTNVATVDNAGNVTTWCAGYATITASADNGAVSGSCYLTVVGVNVTHVPTPKPTPTPGPTLPPGATPTPPPGGVTAYVNTPKGGLNVREKASQNSKILATIPEKGSFTLLEKGEKWCKVWYKGKIGHVMTKYVRMDKPLPTLPPGVTPTPTVKITPAPDSPSGTVAIVNTVTGGLNMRAGASSGSKVIKRIPKGAAFTLIQRGETWSHVWYDGVEGYAMTRYFTEANASPTPVGYTPTPKAATLVTPTPPPLTGSRAMVATKNGKGLNMRASASQNSNRVKLLPNGTIIDIISYGKEWCYASHNGSKGYVMTSMLQLGTGVSKSGSSTPAAPAATKPVSNATTKYGQVNTGTGGLNLRKGPGNGYTRILVIPKGAYLIIEQEGVTWSKVNYNGTSGYVMTAFIKKI